MRKILIGTALIAVFSMIVTDGNASRGRRGSGATATTTTTTSTNNPVVSSNVSAATTGFATKYSGLTQGMKDKKEVIAEDKLCFPALATQGPALLTALKAYVAAWKKEDLARKAALEEIRKKITSGTGGNEDLDYQVSLADNQSLSLAAQAQNNGVTLLVKGGNKRDCSVAFRDAINKGNSTSIGDVMTATDAIFAMADQGALAAANATKISAWKTAYNAAKSCVPQQALYLTRATDAGALNNGQAKAAIKFMDSAQNCWDVMRGGTVVGSAAVTNGITANSSSSGGSSRGRR